MANLKRDEYTKDTRKLKVVGIGLVIAAVLLITAIVVIRLFFLQDSKAASGEEVDTNKQSDLTIQGVTMETESENEPEFSGKEVLEAGKEKNCPSAIVIIVLCVLFGIDAVAVIIVAVRIKKERNMEPEQYETTAQSVENEQTVEEKLGLSIGKLHNIGARPYQEDSTGVTMLDDGVLAIVADGMGGLSGGDKVSQKIVFTMLSYGDQLRPGQMDGVLMSMVNSVNEVVNNMLGPDGIYKSGSTLLAVLVRQNRFHWIAVGDSHIYFYRDGRLTQLNQEHNRGQELLRRAARGEISYEEARADKKKSGLTSFIGMGKLKYVDKSNESIPLERGDRIVLMTDGVFNAVSDQEIALVLGQFSDVSQAAERLEQMVLRCANPKQDNFTAVIIGV